VGLQDALEPVAGRDDLVVEALEPFLDHGQEHLVIVNDEDGFLHRSPPGPFPGAVIDGREPAHGAKHNKFRWGLDIAGANW
jgi:hypothetical protein